MTLADLSTIANNYTDENFTTAVILGFANVAVSKINIFLGSKLPLFDTANDYNALSDDWIHTIIIPYVCWSIKMNDSSINEAQIYLFQFEQGLQEIKKNKKSAIPTDYQGDGFKSSFVIKQYRGM